MELEIKLNYMAFMGFVAFAVWCEINTMQSRINEDARLEPIFLRNERKKEAQPFDAFYRKKS